MFKHIILILVAATMVGCASLSPSQLEAIGEFAAAQKALEIEPGDVIRDHQLLIELNHRITNQLRAADRKTLLECFKKEKCSKREGLLKEGGLYDEITAQQERSKKLFDLADELDGLVQPIELYVQLLGDIATLDQSEEIKASAQITADSVQTALSEVPANIATIKNQLNSEVNAGRSDDAASKLVPNTGEETAEEAEERVRAISSYVGAFTYWTGQRYLRVQQSRALEKAIVDADPLITSLVTDINDTIDVLVNIENIKTLGNYATFLPVNEQITKEKHALFLASLDEGRLTNSSYSTEYRSTTEVDLKQSIAAAKRHQSYLQQFAKAHNDLAAMIAKKEGSRKARFGRFIAKVKVINDELKAAKDLQKTLTSSSDEKKDPT